MWQQERLLAVPYNLHFWLDFASTVATTATTVQASPEGVEKH